MYANDNDDPQIVSQAFQRRKAIIFCKKSKFASKANRKQIQKRYIYIYIFEVLRSYSL